MCKGLEILSDATIFSKYAKYIPEKKRRETWEEIIERYAQMLIKKYPSQEEAIRFSLPLILSKKILPSMRALQFAGLAAEVNHARIYNCCYLPIDSIYSFSETMFLLLGGTGVGYSIQKHHIDLLPKITKPTKNRRYLIEDSIIGWADAVKMLMKAYFMGAALPIFDYRAIRPKGSRLMTAGGKAPGPAPLKICLTQLQTILESKENESKLSPLEAHDVLCHIANAVLAGGIRRAAMIALFSFDDEEMLTCKFGAWYEKNEQRGRANNSVVLERGKITRDQFDSIWKRIQASGSGEPGIYWTNNKDWGTNPCGEISLRPYQVCNLVEVNVSNIESQQDLNTRVAAASYFGTLQAGFTDFHYLRPIWSQTTQRDALIGVSMTGIASGAVLKANLKLAAYIVTSVNRAVSAVININEAARTTCIKPAGTTSLVLGTSSGIHAWQSEYYLRTMRFGKNEAIAMYLMKNYPEICENDILRPADTICVRVPVKAPKEAIFRNETALDLLERIKKFSEEWIKPGHNTGDNTHNVSATISINKNTLYYPDSNIYTTVWKDDFDPLLHIPVDEWKIVADWMWKNRDVYNGLAIFPYDGGTYVQAPFEDITKEEYEERISSLKSIDFSQVKEEEDYVEFNQVAACAGPNGCEVK